MVTTVADSGAGSLRQAISSANSAAGADTILFGFTAGSFPVISLLSALPVIAGDVFLDAALAVGAGPEVVLDGAAAGSAVGLSITGSNVTVKGLVIRNFSSHGILVNGSNHVIANNYIGTDVTGTVDLGNGGDGVDVVSGTNNTVGPGNLVSGNTGTGVHLALGSTFGTVIGNKIGVNASGNAAIPNLNGVVVDGDSGGNIIGGAAVGEGNHISGNTDYGIKMNSTVDGSTSAPSGFIRGNYIGTGAGGLGDLGNGKSGVFLSSSIGVRVGGTATGEGNIISGNNTYGVEINSGSRHQLMGNWIGLDSTGTATVANSQTGVYINGSDLNVVGSQVATARNVIAGNGLHGVNLLSGGDSNTLLGNFIGTDKTGTLDLGNTGDGIRIQSVLQTTIGGGGTNAGNVISGNGGDGVFISVNSASLSVATLKANMIGMNAAGTGSVGNTGNGINISNASGGATIIGSAGSGNIIGGNGLSGIVAGTADLLTIQGNTIGKSGAANARGILLNTTAGATVGGIVAGQGNNVGFNTGNGIALGSAATAIIRGNSLHDNGALGIDLNNNGVTANDANDTDSGANGLLNFPVITTAVATGSSTIVSGTYAGLANTDLNLDFYSNTAGGEAETYLGTFAITTDGSGNGTFSTTLGVVPAGRTVSATATRAVSPFHTSEVSALVAQTSATPSLTISDVTAAEGASGTTNFVFTVTLSAAIATDVTVNFATANGTAAAGSDYTAASGTLTFTAGQTSKTITVGVLGDTASEAAETFFVNLTSPVGATLADSQGLGTINNDDLPLISVNDVSIVEGNSGTSNLIFTVSLNSTPASTVTVDFATANGTASAGSDYASATGTLTFAAGETSKTVTVAVNGDVTVELAETLFLNLTNASGGTISDAQGLGTISNDDAPVISVDDVSIAEGNSGTSNLVFTVSLNTPSVIAVTVDFATANGTATAGGDYVATSGTLTFAAGQTSKTVSVTVNGDVTVEQAETLFLNLTNPGSATISDAQGLGTITNDDTALVTINDATITEGNSGATNMVFTVSLSNPSASSITVDFATGDGTAVAVSDYVTTSGTLTFTAGQVTKTVTVVALGDLTVEQAETLFLNLTNPSGATISDAQGLGTISNDDTALVTIADATIAEGNSGTTNMVFTISLSNPSASSITVDFATADGTALAGSDYTATAGTLTFAAGETSKTVTVALNGDAIVEPAETLFLNLANPNGATISDAQGLGTITNDDSPVITVNDVSIAEGNSGTSSLTFTVSLNITSISAVTVDFATANGTATAGSDYVATSGTLTFAAGQTSKTVTVLVNGDVTVEQAETLFLNLTNPSGATISDAQGLGTITNDDTALVTINDTTITEGNSGATNMVFTISLSNPSASTITVDFATASGTALAGSDYVTTSGTLTFAAGQVTKTVTVVALGDLTVEQAETLFLNLTNPSGATISDAQGLGTITNDDTALVTISDATISEGNSGTTNMVFTVTLSNPSASAITVDFATADGTALAGSDYAASTGTITFAAGETSRTVSVPVSGDVTVEFSETLFVNLTNANGATITDAQGLGTISNDDAPVISVDDVSIAEGDSGTSNLVFTVSLNTPSVIAVTVDFATANGTAAAGSDYVATSGTLTFAAGQTSKTVSVVVNGDVTVEQAETLFLNLTNPSAATIADAQGLGTISNDDTALVTITDATITEGNSGTTNMVFTVSLSNPSASSITVDFATADGTALAGSDYVAMTGTLTFAAGETTKTVTAVALGDVTVEQAETLFLNLTNPSGATISDAQGLGMISNDDTAFATIADATILEGDAGTTDLVFTITLSNPSDSVITLDFATADGIALAVGDYVATAGTITFTPGQTTNTVTVVSLGDGLPELTETLFLNLSNALGATITDAQALGTITNDDTPSLTIGDVSLAEGDGGDALFTFTVLLSKASTLAVTVDFATVAGSALAGLDFAAASGQLTIPVGETSVQFTVSIAGENLVEEDETFTVVLSAPQYATLADDTALATIFNDDATTLNVADVSLSEGDAETTNAAFVVTLTAPSASDITFDFTTRDGSALVGSDYVFTAGFFTIPAGTTSVEILVPIVGDALLSTDETFSLDLSNVSGAIEGVLTADGAILNDDAAVTISIGDIATVEGRSGTKDFVFTVQLSGGLEDEMSVDFVSTAGTAEAGVDYTDVSGTLTIPAGETSATILVPVMGDTDVEFNETFSVTLSALIGTPQLSIADDTATGIIRNDDFEFSITGGSFTETGNYVFTVTLSGTSDTVETVDYATRTDTATGTDFVAAGGTLTFAPGETSATFSFAITSDTLTEIDEAFFVDLSNATAAVATGTAQIVILDDDAPDILLAASPTALEDGTDDAGRVAFKISLSHPSTLPITIHLQTIAGAATGADFNVIDTDIFFAPGQTEFESEVIIRGDLFAEADETFTIQISDIKGAQVGAAVSILDNDGLLISKNRKTATWRDLDGDLVTLTATKPILTSSIFGFRFGDPFPAAPTRSGQLLESLDLTAAGAAAQGVSLTFTAKRKDALGDKLVNVGAIHAAGIKLGAVTIPGDLGKIETGTGLAKLTLGSLGSLGTTTQAAGGDLLSSVGGNLGALKVLGNFSGATLRITGDLGATTIGGSLSGSGGIFAGGKITDISIKRDILGDASNTPVRITATGSGKTPAINSLAVGGNVQNAEILAGYNTAGALVNGGASIGKIAVLRNWVASSVSAGVDRGGDGHFGTNEDFLGASPLIARIASIVITGGVFGTPGGGDHFGFVAEQIDKLKIDGIVQRLTPGVDTLSLGTSDVVAREYVFVL